MASASGAYEPHTRGQFVPGLGWSCVEDDTFGCPVVNSDDYPCSCGKPSLPGLNPFCAGCELRVLIVARETFPEEADKDFEREVPRG